jgi:hypothetical protein
MYPSAGDEAPHEPDSSSVPRPTWKEWWAFGFGDPPGLNGGLELELRPVVREVSLRVGLLVPDLGHVGVRDEELSMPRRAGALVVRGDGLWVDLQCETPFEHWTIGMEAFGLLVEDVDDEVGERIPVGLDLEWEIANGVDVAASVEIAPPGEYGMGAYAEGGYTQEAGTMRGEVLVGDLRFELDAHSGREHRWGGEIPPPTP